MRKLLLVFCTSLCLGTGALAHAETLIRFSHVVDENTPKGQAANYFAELVNDRLEDDIRIEVYPDGKLLSDTDAIKAIQKNEDEEGLIIVPSLSLLHSLAPALKIFDLPGLFNDQEDIDKLTDSPLADEVVKQLKESGVMPLAFWHNGMRMFSVSADGSLEESTGSLDGKLIRIEDSEIQAAFLESVGATPRVMAFTELTDALKNKSIDGQANTWSNIYTQDVHKHQDYIFEPGFTYLGYLVLVNKEFWNGLPQLTQRQLQWAIGEATYIQRKLAIEINEQQRQKIIADNRVEIVTLSEDQRAQWLASSEDVESRFSTEIGPELLKEVHELLGH